MNDLISRKALIEAMEKKYDVANETGMYPTGLSEAFIITEEIIQEQPIAYDLDKIIERLADKIDPNVDADTGEPCNNWVVDMQNELIMKCIEIIKGGCQDEFD